MTPTVFLLSMLAAIATGGADSAGSAGERWLKEVHLLILPEEEAAFRELKDAVDRNEFEKIFWARRDPNPGTAENEYREEVARLRARADQLFAVAGRKGSQTGCGQVFALLREPQEVEGREIQATFQSLPVMREGARRPEVWIYKSRPGDPVAFTGGELRIAFDEECRFSEGGRVLDDLRRAAQSRVVQPQRSYAKRADGHLVPSSDVRPVPRVAPALLESPRTDFPIAVEPKLLLRTQRGEAYVAGLVRWEAGAGSLPSASPPTIDAIVVAQAVDASGQATRVVQRPARAAVARDGTATAAYEMTLAPGRYTIRVGVIAGEKAAWTSTALEVPDFGMPGLKLGSLFLYPPARQAGAEGEPSPTAIAVGSLRIEPRFGNLFSRSDELQAVCAIYGGEHDSAGKGALRARFSFLKDGKPVAKGEEETFATPIAVASVGPVPLAGFAPGRYVVRFEATDTLAGKTETRDAPFQIEE